MPAPTEPDNGRTPRAGARALGRPPRISREQIVAAALCIPRGELTMGAVADALGVSRKALHYYVGDRESLIALVVADLFERQLADVDLPENATWQTLLRVWAHAIRDGVIHVGVAATYVQLHGMSGASVMDLVEGVTKSLLEAGFAGILAQRALTVISNVAFTSASIEMLKQQHGVYPHEAALAVALTQASDDMFPALRQLLATVQRDDFTDSFEFELELAVTGLERALAAQVRQSAV